MLAIKMVVNLVYHATTLISSETVNCWIKVIYG